MSNLKAMNAALEKATTVKEIFTLGFVADRSIKNYEAVTGRKDGGTWFEQEVLALMQIFNDKPDYMKCDKMSIWGCLINTARKGLSIADGDVDLIPYGKIMKADPNYRGMRKQLRTMPSIKFIGEAQIVWKGEEFKHDKLNNKILKHESGSPPKQATLDNCDAAYVRLEMVDGKIVDVVMYNYEIVAAKNRSKMKGEGSVWEQFAGEMIKKTVIRRANKIYYQRPENEIKDEVFSKFEDVTDAQEEETTATPAEAAAPEPAPTPEPPVGEAKIVKKPSAMSALEDE